MFILVFFVGQYRNIREVTRVIHAKSPGLYQVTNWSYGQKTQQKGGEVGKWGVEWQRELGTAVILGEIHAKTPGLYHVSNWSYGQKLRKITIFKRLRNVWFSNFFVR